jgi:hypothetical protein
MKTQELDRIRFVTRHFNELQGLRYGVPLGLITVSLGGTTYFQNPSWLGVRSFVLLVGVLLPFAAAWYYRRAFGEVERQAFQLATPELLWVYSPAGPSASISHGKPLPAGRMLIVIALAFFFLLMLRAVSPHLSVSEDESLVQAPWTRLAATLAVYDEPLSPFSARGVPSELSATLRTEGIYALFGGLLLSVWLWRGRRWSQAYYALCGLLLLGLSAFGAVLGFFLKGTFSPQVVQRVDTLSVPAVHLWIALLLCGAAMIVTGLLDHRQLVRALKPTEVAE